MDGGEFVGEWLMAGECDVLVSVSGFSVDVEIERSIRVVNYINVQHRDFPVLLDFFRLLDILVNGVEVVMQWLDVVVANGGDGIVGFSEPEQNDLAGTDVVVTSRIIGESCSLEVFHEDIRQWTAC